MKKDTLYLVTANTNFHGFTPNESLVVFIEKGLFNVACLMTDGVARWWVLNYEMVEVADISVNKFRELKKYINSNSKGMLISRKSLIEYFGEDKKFFNSLDCYRNYFHQAGFLETVSRGIYKVIKHIPETLSKRDLIKLAYEK